MDRVTQSIAAGAEETAGAAEELNAQAMSLRDSVMLLQNLVGAGAGGSQPASPQGPPPRPESTAGKNIQQAPIAA